MTQPVARALAVALPAVLLLSASTSAATPDQARDRLISADLSPAPIYPQRLPARLRSSNAKLTVSGPHFAVAFDRGRGSRGLPIGYLQFGRGPHRQLTDDMRIARSRGYRPRTTLVGGRKVIYLCGHICAYEWRAQGFTYGVFGIYHQRPGAERPDQRALIRSLGRLPGEGEGRRASEAPRTPTKAGNQPRPP